MGFESLDHLAEEVFAILGKAGIPAEIIGGYALSHYGYVRNTVDIDVVVGGDYSTALKVLKDHGFTEAERVFKLMTPAIPDKRVDVLPAGKRMSGSPTPNPIPSRVGTTPVFVPLKDLLALKIGVLLSMHAGVEVDRKNEADLYALIRINKLPKTFMDGYPHEDTRLHYWVMWDELDREKQVGKTSSLDESYDPFSDFFNT